MSKTPPQRIQTLYNLSNSFLLYHNIILVATKVTKTNYKSNEVALNIRDVIYILEFFCSNKK